MDSVTASATGRGLEPPAFHVFSESVLPCPSPENGTFREFPLWPVEMDQVRTLLEGMGGGNTRIRESPSFLVIGIMSCVAEPSVYLCLSLL